MWFMIGITWEQFQPKGKIDLSGGTPCKSLVIVLRLWIGPHLEDLYFYCLIHWVIETTGELCHPNRQRRPILWDPGKFHLSSSYYWLSYIFDISVDSCLTYTVILIIGTHIWKGSLIYIFLSSSKTIKHRPSWTISRSPFQLFWK